jgi:signal transduction histidine kinase
MAYLASTAILVIIIALRVALEVTVEGSSPFLLLLIAVMAAAWMGGTGPALFITALAALAGHFFFAAPEWSLAMGSKHEAVEVVLFLIEGCVLAVLAGRLHAARNAALAGQAEARSLQEELLRVTDDERRRISQDLHDGVGQHLTGTSMMAKRLSHRLTDLSPEYAEDAANISRLLNEAIGSTRDLGKLLAPPLLSHEGLGSALAELCQSAEQLLGIRCTLVDRTNEPLLDPVIGMHLYRITQEGISNAAKHGHAKVVEVELTRSGTSLCLQVTSDGTPFVEPSASGSGLGWRIMRYRATMIGASLRAQTLPDGRTAIICMGNP